jgi:LPS export ABC transporter permease LptG
MDRLRRHSKLLLLTLALAAVGAVAYMLLLPGELRAIDQQLLGFPDSDIPAHQARTLVLAGLCALPTLACVAYAFGDTLDRYITRQFLGIFGICLSALFMIWLLIDLSDKISEFRDTRHVLRTIAAFYGARSPAILLLLLPYSLLLALLYALGKLSSQREIIAVIQSGRGVVRTSLPLVIAGGFCTLLSLGLNYHWAPIAEGRQDEILAEASGEQATEASKVLYRNPENGRLWMIGAFPPDYEKGKPLLNVEVTTTGDDLALVNRISASHATWDLAQRRWTFENAVIGRFLPDQAPTFESPAGPLVIDSWPETPWQLIKPGLNAAYLGIPDLNTWLQANARSRGIADPAPYLTHWHYRWALPFACLVTVLLAAPLAIHFSRRGPGGGVFLAVVLSALMLLAGNVSLAMGESGLLRPAFAAWLPNLIFGLLGLYLFHRRVTGRPIYQFLRRVLPGGD